MQLAIINPLKGLYSEFVKITQGIEVKYSNKAEIHETLESSQHGDEYVAAALNQDSFESYVTYDEDLLKAVGITDPLLLSKCLENRENIPYAFRDILFQMKRRRVLVSYEEPNRYYRIMTGKPNKADGDYVYANGFEEYGISGTTPIHELDNTSISVLRDLGYIDKIIAEYPKKEYLKYLGDKSIPIEISRPARNFSLIRTPDTNEVNDIILSEFKLIYEQCREYFVSVIYIPEYTQIYEYYDNFIALCIMVMTIQQIIMRNMKTTIDRDFFDEYCISLLFEMYRIPEIPGIAFADKKAIAQNLNILIQNKATDKVLYDIANILGFSNVGIYKYLIVKQQKFDNNGKPVHVDPPEGREKTIEEYSQEFNLYFQKLEVKDRDAYQALQVTRNKESYNEITSADPFWYDDEVKQTLYEAEYNYAESKYLSINVAFKLSEIMFECIYFLNMCIDKKNELSKIKISLPKILGRDSVSIFDCVIACCTLLCKKHGLCGEIPHDASDILYIEGFDYMEDMKTIKADIQESKDTRIKRQLLGFNFDADFDAVKKEILTNRFIDSSLVKYLENMMVYNTDSVNRLYKNIYNLRDELTDAMARATDIRAYRAYKKLWKTLYVKEASDKVFAIGTDNEGKPIFADTFRDFLRYVNPELYTALDDAVGLSGDMESPFSPWNQKREFSNPDSAWNFEKDKATAYISHILARLNATIADLKELYTLNDITGGAINALITLIRFFKSYTTDMIGLNVVYLFNTRALNMIHLMDYIAHIKKDNHWGESLKLTHSDAISKVISKMNEDEKLPIHDEMISFVSIALDDSDSFALNDWMDYKIIIERNERLKKGKRGDTCLTDIIIIPVKHIGSNERLMIEDTLYMQAYFHEADHMSFKDRYVRDFYKEHKNDPGIILADKPKATIKVASVSDSLGISDTASEIKARFILKDNLPLGSNIKNIS